MALEQAKRIFRGGTKPPLKVYDDDNEWITLDYDKSGYGYYFQEGGYGTVPVTSKILLHNNNNGTVTLLGFISAPGENINANIYFPNNINISEDNGVISSSNLEDTSSDTLKINSDYKSLSINFQETIPIYTIIKISN